MNDGSQPMTESPASPPAHSPRRAMLFFFPAAFLLALIGYVVETIVTPHYRFALVFVPAALALLPGRVRELGMLYPGTPRGLWLCWGPAACCVVLGVVFSTPRLSAAG